MNYISTSAVVKGSIKGLNGLYPKNLYIGDHVYIGEDVQIICDDFVVQDYSKIHHHTNIHGNKVHIGYNAWIGQYSLIDGLGETVIGNNCGIGAHSQLWSHIKYGDLLEGCNFNSTKNLIVEDDVWFVGHCIVSPIHAHSKSMALVGSVITNDMEANHVYAGVPAKDLTNKIGNQFREVPLAEKSQMLKSHLDDFKKQLSGDQEGELIVILDDESLVTESCLSDNVTYFIVGSRQYTKKNSVVEILFMKYLLPDKAKFVPYDNHSIQ